MDVKYCPQCRSEYVARVATCPDCDVELVDKLPARVEDDDGRDDEVVDASGVASGQKIVYDLGGWSVEQREVLEQLLQAVPTLPIGIGADQVEVLPHVWEGTSLVVAVHDEGRVNDLVSQVEVDVDLSLDPDADKVAYDCAGLPDDEFEAVLDALVEELIPHALSDDEELFVLEDDEERVDAIFDRIVDPDELDTESDGGGRVAPEVLGEVFVAVDRLQKNARDAEGVIGVVEGLEVIHEVSLPFGFEPATWNGIIDDIAALSGLIQDDDTTDDVIEEAARALRRRLREYV